MKGRTPTSAERQWLNAIVGLGCIVCRNDKGCFTEAAVHHINGKTKPGAHFKTLPLCFLHHQGGADCHEYVSRHPYKARFEQRYGTEQALLEQCREILDWEVAA